MGMSGNVFPRTFLEEVMPMPETGGERGADTYLFNLATLTGQVGAIDEALGGYRVHGNNVLAKVKKGNVNKLALRKFLQRKILTDQSLNDYGQKIGVDYRLGTLTGSLPHIQQLFLHEKLYREDRCFGEQKCQAAFFLVHEIVGHCERSPALQKAGHRSLEPGHYATAQIPGRASSGIRVPAWSSFRGDQGCLTAPN
jgi:hypothetical protein